MNNFEDLGKRFAYYMKYKGLGVNETAKILGFSGSQISNIVNGKVFGTDKTFKILNKFNELSAEWLFTGKEPMLKIGNIDNRSSLLLNTDFKELSDARLEIIEFQKEKIARLEKDLAEMKYTQSEPIVYPHVAESAPELIKNKDK